MIIVNQSGVDLTINGYKVSPVKEYMTDENAFNTQSVYSDIGSVEITTEYGNRSFACHGKLTAYEDKHTKDHNGLPHIIIENTMGIRADLIVEGRCSKFDDCPLIPKGRWEDYNAYFKKCSLCHKVVGFDYIEQEGEVFKYCPNCGARMFGGDKE